MYMYMIWHSILMARIGVYMMHHRAVYRQLEYARFCVWRLLCSVTITLDSKSEYSAVYRQLAKNVYLLCVDIIVQCS